MKKICTVLSFMFLNIGFAQNADLRIDPISYKRNKISQDVYRQFIAMSALLDASCNSLNALASLVKKEAYRMKIVSLNNPTSTELGFSLRSEIETAIQPILRKAKSVNPTKFHGVISSLISTPQKAGFSTTNIPSTILSLVGTLILNEKKLSQEDLDSFLQHISKYFIHYQRLDRANQEFDLNIKRLNAKLSELQFDVKEYMYDMILVLHPNISRSQIKSLPIEDNILRFLDQSVIEKIFDSDSINSGIYFPADGIKGAKEITYTIHKLYIEYEKAYVDNFTEIKSILIQSKQIANRHDASFVDKTLKELEYLYHESKKADLFNIRMNTLFERLKVLVNSENVKKKT